MNIFQEMLITPTAHHICDSGAIYGRNYERNKTRDFANEPQATLTIDKFGPEVSVSVYHHLNACLEQDPLCILFNRLDCRAWDSDLYGISAAQQLWLEDHGLFPEGEAWNTYNWDNNFDQVMQGQNLTEDYVLLQIHGGCDVRSGYTDARLFKIRDWMNDYFLFDDCSFYLPSEGVTVDVRGWIGNAEIYDHDTGDTVDISDEFWDRLPPQTIEGVQYACEH